MYRILIIEDEQIIAKGLSKVLEQYGFEPIILETFDQIDQKVMEINPHLILLDINLPYYNGFYWCVKIRKQTLCPIIIISAKNENSDQVMALENGADDYICKPFYNDIVIAKVRSQLRRCYGDYKPEESHSIFEKEGFRLDKSKLVLYYGRSSVFISPKELVLLEAILQRFPNAVRREVLLEKVWDNQTFVDENTLNVNIARVRKKLQEVEFAGSLETVRGYGYKLVLPDVKPS